MSKKKKVLIHSNHSKALTGFGKNARNILIGLQKTGKYEIVEFCNGSRWGDPRLKNLPWKCEGSLPSDPALVQQLNKDPNLARQAGYGAQMIDKIIEQEKPDVYIGAEDIWAFSGYTQKKWWNKINCMIWTTLDSLPILPEALKNADKIKNYYVWASFAEKEMKRLGHDHVKTLHGAVDPTNFIRLDDDKRLEIRKKNGIDKDDFIIGFVFRNQLRKSVPNLLEGFKIFQKQNPTCKAKLLLHTSWQEGWDIPRLIKEKGLKNEDILTTYVCKSCKEYEIKPFCGDSKETGESQPCKYCGGKDTQSTTNVRFGVDEPQLNEVYNAMDVYCHPFTSGGQEIPIQEAKLTELVTLATNYSCGEDCCGEESGGFPLSWTEYREPGTQFIKASTSAENIAYQLRKVLNLSKKKRENLGKKARDFVMKNYSVESVCKKLEGIIDLMPEIDWDFNFEVEKKDPTYDPPEIASDEEWITDLYKNILKIDTDETDDGHKHWIKRLKSDMSRKDVLDYFKKTAADENGKNNKVPFEDILDKDDEGKRILISMPQSIGDVYLCTSLLKNMKELYPDYNIYFATKPQYFSILAGNPYIHKCIPYSSALDSLPAMEGQGAHKGYFEIAFLPFIGTQRILNYMHNGKDKIQFELCT